jgi:hypothetical protein
MLWSLRTQKEIIETVIGHVKERVLENGILGTTVRGGG